MMYRTRSKARSRLRCPSADPGVGFRDACANKPKLGRGRGIRFCRGCKRWPGQSARRMSGRPTLTWEAMPRKSKSQTQSKQKPGHLALEKKCEGSWCMSRLQD